MSALTEKERERLLVHADYSDRIGRRTLAEAIRKAAERPLVVVIEYPQDEPTVLVDGDVEIAGISSYAVSRWCSDDEFHDYAENDLWLEEVTALRDRFPEGSYQWRELDELVAKFHERAAKVDGRA